MGIDNYDAVCEKEPDVIGEKKTTLHSSLKFRGISAENCAEFCMKMSR